MARSTDSLTHRRQQGGLREASFSLIELVVAMTVMAAVIGGFARINGNAIYFNEYERNATHATWLAKRVMSQVEYFWKSRPFKELETNQEAVPFQEIGEIGDEDGFFRYNLRIQEWEFPLLDMLTGGAPGASEEEDDAEGQADPQSDLIKQGIETALDGEPLLKVAMVEVSWPEGARRNSVSLSLLLTNQAKADQQMARYKDAYEKAKRASLGIKNTPPPNPNTSGGGNRPGGTGAGAGGAGGGGAGGGTTPAGGGDTGN